MFSWLTGILLATQKTEFIVDASVIYGLFDHLNDGCVLEALDGTRPGLSSCVMHEVYLPIAESVLAVVQPVGIGAVTTSPPATLPGTDLLERAAELLREFEELLDGFTVYPLDEETAWIGAFMTAHLGQKPNYKAADDHFWSAVLAIQLGLPLRTRDPKQYQHILDFDCPGKQLLVVEPLCTLNSRFSG